MLYNKNICRLSNCFFCFTTFYLPIFFDSLAKHVGKLVTARESGDFCHALWM